ncbi:MAG: hypothetical protein ACPGRC_11485, partial [Salibacteraceae bacterium]
HYNTCMLLSLKFTLGNNALNNLILFIMKKTMFILVAGAIFLSSCSKDTLTTESSVQNPEMSAIEGESEETQIKDFLANYDVWKATGNITIPDMPREDALWLMEASINYKNAFQLSYWEKQHVGESEYYPSISTNNESYFTGASILTTFAAMDAAIQAQVQAQNHDMVLLVDLFLDGANSAQIGMRGVTASSLPITNVANPLEIGNDDYWFLGNNAGKCGAYAGQNTDMDAAERVEDIINHNWWNAYYLSIYNPQDVIYYTNVNTIHPTSYLWPAALNSCQTPSNMDAILTYDENGIFSNIPNSNQLIIVGLTGQVIGSTGTPSTYVKHFGDVSYGIPNIQ